MIYVRDELAIDAGIAAQSEYARVWNPGGKFISDPALAPLPEKHSVMIHTLQVWVITTLGFIRRGVSLELINLSDQRGERATLKTIPIDGVLGFNGIRYTGAPFLCEYGVGWWARKTALIDTNVVHMRIGWEKVKYE